MSVKKHITSEEEVLDYCTTDIWAWVCTDGRVIKYRTDGNGEQLDDISLDEITGISITTTGKSDKMRGYSIMSAIGAVSTILYSLIGGQQIFVFGAIPFFMLFYIFHKKWQRSANGYFELRGTGLIRQEPEKWKIRSEGDSEEVQSFVKTIRENI